MLHPVKKKDDNEAPLFLWERYARQSSLAPDVWAQRNTEATEIGSKGIIRDGSVEQNFAWKWATSVAGIFVPDRSENEFRRRLLDC